MTASPPELFSGSGDDMMSTLGVVMSAKLCQRMLYSEWAPGFPRRDIDERWRFAVDNVGHRIRTSLEAHGCVLGARVPWYNTPCVLCLLKSGCGLVAGLAATSVSPAFRRSVPMVKLGSRPGSSFWPGSCSHVALYCPVWDICNPGSPGGPCVGPGKSITPSTSHAASRGRQF